MGVSLGMRGCLCQTSVDLEKGLLILTYRQLCKYMASLVLASYWMEKAVAGRCDVDLGGPAFIKISQITNSEFP